MNSVMGEAYNTISTEIFKFVTNDLSLLLIYLPTHQLSQLSTNDGFRLSGHVDTIGKGIERIVQKFALEHIRDIHEENIPEE